MLRVHLLLACLFLAAGSLPLRAQDDESRAIVLQAIKAHGGKETLAKYKAVQVKYKGDVDANGVMAKIEGEVSMNYPDRMKNVMGLDVNNMNIKISQGYDGKMLWMDFMGTVQETKDKDQLDEMNESIHAGEVANLLVLESKDCKLSSLGEMKIMGRDAVGVRVSKEGKRDVNLWIDKKTHLCLKSEHRGKDPFNPGAQEANQEKYYSDYKLVQGVQTPHTVEVHNDGKKLVSMELTETRYYENFLDPSTFARP